MAALKPGALHPLPADVVPLYASAMTFFDDGTSQACESTTDLPPASTLQSAAVNSVTAAPHDACGWQLQLAALHTRLSVALVPAVWSVGNPAGQAPVPAFAAQTLAPVGLGAQT